MSLYRRQVHKDNQGTAVCLLFRLNLNGLSFINIVSFQAYHAVITLQPKQRSQRKRTQRQHAHRKSTSMIQSLARVLIPPQGTRVSLALLSVRIITGIAFMLHGAPKWEHPFTWADHGAPIHGIPPLLQACVWTAELIGGACIVIGLLTPLFTLMQVVDMTVVITAVALPSGWAFWVSHGPSWEMQGHLWIGAAVVLLCGPGRFSIDALLSRRI